MIKEYLPIGSVVILKGAKKRLMITGYCMRDLGSKKQYDYSGCLYPEGILDTKETALFDHEQIETILNLKQEIRDLKTTLEISKGMQKEEGSFNNVDIL